MEGLVAFTPRVVASKRSIFLEEVKSILIDVKQRGALVAVRRLCSTIYGAGYYNLYYRKPLATTTSIQPVPQNGYEMRELNSNSNSSQWLERLADVWPSELEYYKRPAMFGYLQNRVRKGEVCFLVTEKENVLGAVWLAGLGKNWKEIINLDSDRTFVVKSLFVVPQARGLGISKHLFAQIFNYSNNAGKALVSFIKDSRTASIKAHEATGFVYYGRTFTRTILGHSKHQFMPGPGKNN